MPIANLTGDGLRLPAQDLSTVTPASTDDSRMYNHDGSAAITLTSGGTSTKNGFYVWDNSQGAWNPLKLTFAVANQLETDGATSVVRDTTNALDVARFKEGGAVEIPNGSISASTWGEQFKAYDTDVNAVDVNDYASFGVNGGLVKFGYKDASAGTFTALITSDTVGNVEIPNGKLTLGAGMDLGGNITGTWAAPKLITNGSGTDQWEIYDGANAQDILVANEGGNVGIPNGNLDFNVADGSVTSLGWTPTGLADDIDWERHTNLPGGDAAFSVFNKTAGTRNFIVRDDGNVDIPNGSLSVTGDYPAATLTRAGTSGSSLLRLVSGEGATSELLSVNGTGLVLRGNTTATDGIIVNGSNVNVPNGHLAINGASPTNRVLKLQADTDSNEIVFSMTDSSNTTEFIQGELATHGGGLLRVKDDTNTSKVTLDSSGTSRLAGGSVEIPNGSLTQGVNPIDVISETTSPKGFDFLGDSGRDIHGRTEVTISNGTTSSATETITVELYDGTDTTGTLLASTSKSITVAAGASSTTTFISGDVALDNGTYHINVTQSGTTLSVDQTDEYTKGATYEFGQTNTGGLFVRTQDGIDVLAADAISGDLTNKGTRIHEGLPAHLSLTHASWESGLADEEVDRIALAAGETLRVERLAAELKGGGTNANFTLEVYDATNLVSVASTTAGTVDSGTYTSNSGAAIVVRVSNADTVALDVALKASMFIE